MFWLFDRPDQRHMIDSVLNDETLSDEEKTIKIEKCMILLVDPLMK